MVYDATWHGRATQVGLTSSWIAGSALYRALGRLDAAFGARSWAEALDWLLAFEPQRKISQVQYWGHGRWGRVFIGKEPLDGGALEDDADLRHPKLRALKDRVVDERALFWFRTCETFGKDAGHAFARSWTRFFRCRAAGHTYVIGPWQSGLHSLGPGDSPTWSTTEGLGGDAKTALMSGPKAPNTITCLHGEVPAGW